MSDPGEAVLPFGDYRHQRLRDIAATDAGLAYLHEIADWHGLWPHTRDAIRAYLKEPKVAQALRLVLVARHGRAADRRQGTSHAQRQRNVEYGLF
jgi:hypothetical protein